MFVILIRIIMESTRSCNIFISGSVHFDNINNYIGKSNGLGQEGRNPCNIVISGSVHFDNMNNYMTDTADNRCCKCTELEQEASGKQFGDGAAPPESPEEMKRCSKRKASEKNAAPGEKKPKLSGDRLDFSDDDDDLLSHAVENCNS